MDALMAWCRGTTRALAIASKKIIIGRQDGCADGDAASGVLCIIFFDAIARSCVSGTSPCIRCILIPLVASPQLAVHVRAKQSVSVTMNCCGISIGPASRGNSIERDRARVRERLARIRQATPKWLTADQHAEIKAIYADARRLTASTGYGHHVDHIIPIWGENVRGLHVPWNLCVVTAANNLRKTNRMVC